MQLPGLVCVRYGAQYASREARGRFPKLPALT